MDDSLFWQEDSSPITSEGAGAWHSPEQTGARVVECVTAWLDQAIECLPAEYSACLKVELDRPEWIEPSEPAHALHELQRLLSRVPSAVPDWWELSRDQRRAVNVVMAARGMVESIPPDAAPEHILPIMEQTLALGVRVAQAHTEPWEAVALTGKKHRDGGDKGRDVKVSTAQERKAVWQAMAADKWASNLRWSAKQVGELVASDLADQQSEHYGSPNTIRRHIKRPPPEK